MTRSPGLRRRPALARTPAQSRSCPRNSQQRDMNMLSYKTVSTVIVVHVCTVEAEMKHNKDIYVCMQKDSRNKQSKYD